MTDVREAILARIAEVVDVSGLATVARNKLQLSDTSRPAVIVLDGNEQTESGYGGGRPSITPVIVTMRPEVWFFAGGSPEAIGATVSAFRAAIIKAVLSDSSLLALTKDGDIRYEGMNTSFSSGARIEADVGLIFSLRYTLRPNEL